MDKLLRDRYNIPVESYEHQLSALYQLIKNGESRMRLPKLIKCLEGKKIYSIGMLLRLNESEILSFRDIGTKTIDFLFVLLDRATTIPLQQEKEKPKRDKAERLIQKYLERIMKNNE